MLLASRLFSGASARRLVAAAALCLFSVSAGARAEGEAFDLAPDNSDVVAQLQVGKIFESPAFKKIAVEFPDVAKKLDEPLGTKTKLTPRDIDSIFVAANTAKQEFVVVFNLNDEVDIDDVISEEQQANAKTVGDYTLYALEDNKALCLVDEYTVAIGPKKTLRDVLKRGEDAELSDDLDAAWQALGENEDLYVVATLGTLTKQAAGSIPPGVPLTAETLAKLKTVSLTANVGKSKIMFSANLDCTDTATANQLKTLLGLVVQGAQVDANTPAEAKQALNTVKSSVEEEVLSVSGALGLDVILSQIKSQFVVKSEVATGTP